MNLYSVKTGFGMSDIFASPRYDFFTPGHVLLIILGALALGVSLFFCRNKRNSERLMLIVTSCIFALGSVSLLIYSLASGIYNLEWYLPFHICNLFVVILPLSAAFKKVRNFFVDYMVCCGAVGCALCVIFPITSMLYFPPFHFVSIVIWLQHITIAFVSGFYLVTGIYRKFNCIGLLTVLSVLIANALLVNKLFGTNFLFINFDWQIEPLASINASMGNVGIYVVIALVYFTAIILHITSLVYERIKTKSVRELVTGNRLFIKAVNIVCGEAGIDAVKEQMLKGYNEAKHKIKRKVVLRAVEKFEKLIKSIAKSGIAKKLADTPIESLNIKQVTQIIADSGVVGIVLNDFNLADIMLLENTAHLHESAVTA